MKRSTPRHARKPSALRRWIPWLAVVFCAVLTILLWPHTPLTASSHRVEAAETVPPTQGGTSSISQEKVESAWELRLVNRDHPLPRDFTVELTSVQGGQFDSRAAEKLDQMLEDMKAQGLSPLICSSFRTWEDQDSLHQQDVDKYLSQGFSQEQAEEEASRWVVPAGQSEHQLGLAVDIVAQGFQLLEEEQESTPEQQWLMSHCWEYGFILRYPKGKEAETGVGYEPWHYRYVGKEAAQEITTEGLCLEEYLQE